MGFRLITNYASDVERLGSGSAILPTFITSIPTWNPDNPQVGHDWVLSKTTEAYALYFPWKKTCYVLNTWYISPDESGGAPFTDYTPMWIPGSLVPLITKNVLAESINRVTGLFAARFGINKADAGLYLFTNTNAFAPTSNMCMSSQYFHVNTDKIDKENAATWPILIILNGTAVNPDNGITLPPEANVRADWLITEVNNDLIEHALLDGDGEGNFHTIDEDRADFPEPDWNPILGY